MPSKMDVTNSPSYNSNETSFFIGKNIAKDGVLNLPVHSSRYRLNASKTFLP
jgi:hypothetical protein